MKILILAFLSLGFVSCASNEKAEVKSPLEYLNGATYGVAAEAPAGTSEGVVSGIKGIPVAGAKNKVTRVQGTLMMGSGISTTPLKFTLVRLMDEQGKVLTEATSDLNGKFVLSGKISNGSYLVKVDSQKFSGELKVFVDRYDLDIVVPVVEKTSK